MSKYIDAEDITSTIRKVRTKFAIDSVFGENLREDAAVAGAFEAVAQVIDILPAADVQEVRHGRWIDDETAYICSVCFHGSPSGAKWNYCPNCGAKMDEVSE